MHHTYGDKVEFLLVYIREAHPYEEIPESKTVEQRSEVATTMCTELKLTMPAVIDEIDNTVEKTYAAWPDRLYLIGIDGNIVYKGERGPYFFNPKEFEQAIIEYLDAKSPSANSD